MIEYQLTNGFTTLIDEIDFLAIDRWYWFARREISHGKERIYVLKTSYENGTKKSGKRARVHRVIAVAAGLLSSLSDPTFIDHKDGSGLNNQRFNLRIASPTQNCANSVKRIHECTSRFKGVTWHPKTRKWMAQINEHKKHHYLGIFEQEEEAASTYDVAAIHYFGEFARTNAALGLLP